MVCPGCKEMVYKLRFLPEAEEKWLCSNCAPEAKLVLDANPGHFPFTTTNLHPEGEKLTVRSLRELRKLENRYGVASGPWN
jgi:hypothetical protein